MDENNKMEKIEKSDESTEDLNSIENIEQLLDSDNVPKEHKKIIREMIFSSFQMQAGISSSENTVAKKITEEHITQYLEGSKLDMENSYSEKKQNKIFVFLVLLITMIFVIVVILLLKDKPEIMEKVIYSLGGLVAGALGGYGVGKSKKNE